MIQTVVGHTV